jgi:hypothetical protein
MVTDISDSPSGVVADFEGCGVKPCLALAGFLARTTQILRAGEIFKSYAQQV